MIREKIEAGTLFSLVVGKRDPVTFKAEHPIYPVHALSEYYLVNLRRALIQDRQSYNDGVRYPTVTLFEYWLEMTRAISDASGKPRVQWVIKPGADYREAFREKSACPACFGTGIAFATAGKCSLCNGTGYK